MTDEKKFDKVVKLLKELDPEGWDLEQGGFSDGSSKWIDLRQNDHGRRNQISIHLCFDPLEQRTEIQVWKTPYIYDDDNAERLI